jgi:hypothetical protein
MRLINYRFFKSLQFWLGLGLAAVAFLGVSMYARMFNPEPTQIIVARAEIPAYTRLDKTMLSVDEQHLSPKLAERYVTGSELATILSNNAVAVETIHAGEPLSKQRLVVGPDALKVSRLSLALQDPTQVIRTIPVKPDQFPGDIVPGDLIDLYVTFGSPPSGDISYTRTVTNGLETPGTATAPGISATPNVTATSVPSPKGVLPSATFTATVEEYSAMMPVSKRLISGLLVVSVNHEMVQNPNYGIGAGAESEPAYIEGGVRSLDVLARNEDAEKIDFALTNGKVNIGLRSALARQAIEQGTPVPPSNGWTWTDFTQEFFLNRLTPTP